MELLSVIVALEKLKKDKLNVTIYSDSKYVVDSVEKGWVFSWEKLVFHQYCWLIVKKLLLQLKSQKKGRRKSVKNLL